MKLKPDSAQRAAVYDAIEQGKLGFPDALAKLRRSVGLTQAEYAKRAGIAVRVLKDIEQGRGNPTLESIRKVLTPFDLDIGLCRRNRDV